MKDALGHGSDSRGGAAHQEDVQKATAPMQRRHFEAIARAINTFPHQDARADLAQTFASSLRGTNPNFQADKFRNAAMTGNMGRTQNKGANLARAQYNHIADVVKGFGASHPAIKDDLVAHFSKSLQGEAGGARFKPDRFSKRAS